MLEKRPVMSLVCTNQLCLACLTESDGLILTESVLLMITLVDIIVRLIGRVQLQDFQFFLVGIQLRVNEVLVFEITKVTCAKLTSLVRFDL